MTKGVTIHTCIDTVSADSFLLHFHSSLFLYCFVSVSLFSSLLCRRVSSRMPDFCPCLSVCPCAQRYADLVAAISVVSLVDREGPAGCGR